MARYLVRRVMLFCALSAAALTVLFLCRALRDDRDREHSDSLELTTDRRTIRIPEAGSAPVQPGASAEDAAHDASTADATAITTTAPDDGSHSGIELRGRVVDAATGEPVPYVDVECVGSHWSTRTRSDAQGRFALGRSREIKEPSTLKVSDQGIPLGEFDSAALGDDCTVPITVGPTYWFDDSKLASGLKGWRGRLVEAVEHDDEAHVRVSIIGLSLESRGGGEAATRAWSWIPLRGQGGWWMRYPAAPKAYTTPVAVAPYLELIGDGTCACSAERVRTIGITRNIELAAGTRLCELNGDVVDDSGAAVLDGYIVVASSDARSTVSRPALWNVAKVGAGHFAIDALTAGAYRVTALCPNCALHTEDIELQAGVASLTTIRLTRQPHRLQVHWDSEPNSGTLQQPLVARPLGVPWYLPAWVQPDVDSRYMMIPGERSFDELPAAGYELRRVVFLRGKPVVFAKLATERLIVDQLETSIAPLDADGLCRYSFHVAAWPPGMPRRAIAVTLDPGGAVITSAGGVDPVTLLLPRDSRLEWTVWAEGCIPVRGNERTFDKDGDDRAVRVELRVGWGWLVHARCRDRTLAWPNSAFWSGYTFPGARDMLGLVASPPLSGVKISSAGVEVAETGADGTALIVTTETPSELSVSSPGWTLTALDPAPGLGSHQSIAWFERSCAVSAPRK